MRMKQPFLYSKPNYLFTMEKLAGVMHMHAKFLNYK